VWRLPGVTIRSTLTRFDSKVIVTPAPSANGTHTGEVAAGKPRRRRRPPWPLLLLSGILLLGVSAWAVSELWAALQPPGPLVASGTIEADEDLLSSEVGGRLVELPVSEGQTLQAGQLVARLDDSLIQIQLQQADPATQQQLKVTADKYRVKSPLPGEVTVTRVPVKVGEVVTPGQTIAAIADLHHLSATVYVLERDIGSVQVGQHVEVSADPFPSTTFNATVTSINSQAEFTPRNIQTRQDRLNLVFGVKLRIDNPTLQLKPGMPIDATFY
jgi:HlyD family secretion protein